MLSIRASRLILCIFLYPTERYFLFIEIRCTLPTRMWYTYRSIELPIVIDTIHQWRCVGHGNNSGEFRTAEEERKSRYDLAGMSWNKIETHIVYGKELWAITSRVCLLYYNERKLKLIYQQD